MFNFEIIKIFLFCFYLIIHIKSQLYPYYQEAKFDEDDRETSTFSKGTDFGPCPCDLHRGLCDFNCCCDKDCKDEQIKKFSFECDKYYHEKFINDKFKCQNIKKTFDYYKYRPHENNVYSYKNNEDLNKYNDQIFGLMCMVYDRTGDIGEFNIEFDGDKGNELNRKHDNYNLYFSSNINSAKDIYQKIKNTTDNKVARQIFIFQSDAFGNCIKTLEINYFKPIENVECGMKVSKKTIQENYINDFKNVECDEYFILSNNIINKNNTCDSTVLNDLLSNPNYILKEFFVTIYYEETTSDGVEIFTTRKTKIKSLFLDLSTSPNIKRVKQKFSVNFTKHSEGETEETKNEISKSGLPGYLINKPVLFTQNNNLYERIQIQGADPTDGSCLLNGENINNLNDPFILFKVNNIYSCKLGKVNYYDLANPENFNNYKIFNNFLENDNIRFGKFGFTKYEIQGKVIYNSWNPIIFSDFSSNDNCVESGNIRCVPITQYLIIIFSKFGKKGSSQEYIYDMRLITKREQIEFDFENLDNDYKDIELKFIVKFVSLNEEQFQRNFENDNYKTSLIPLPEDVKYPTND